jgi:hypothetical protein
MPKQKRSLLSWQSEKTCGYFCCGLLATKCILESRQDVREGIPAPNDVGREHAAAMGIDCPCRDAQLCGGSFTGLAAGDE